MATKEFYHSKTNSRGHRTGPDKSRTTKVATGSIAEGNRHTAMSHENKREITRKIRQVYGKPAAY